MITVYCLDDDSKYIFDAISGFDAIQKMLYTLNLFHEDKNAEIDLANGRTWCLTHCGKTYGALM